MFNDDKTCFILQNYFSQVEISYESIWVPLNRRKVSEKRTELKKTEKTHQFHVIKSNKEVTHPQQLGKRICFTEILKN